MPVHLSHRAFEALVADALDSLPERLLRMLDNVAVTVADEPSAAQSAKMALSPGMVLYGLYEGVPLTVRSSGYGMVVPDRITIFQRALEAGATDVDDLTAEVRHTVVHEIAHHFGISDERLVTLGFEAADNMDAVEDAMDSAMAAWEREA